MSAGPQTFVKGYPYKYELLDFPPYRGQPPQECINLAEYHNDPNFLERCSEVESRVIPEMKSIAQAETQVVLKREKQPVSQAYLSEGNAKKLIKPGWAAGSATKWCTFAFVFEDLTTSDEGFDSMYMYRKLIYSEMPVDGISEKVRNGSNYFYGSVKLDDHILYRFQDARNLDFQAHNSVMTFPNNRTMLPALVPMSVALNPTFPVTIPKRYFFQRQYIDYPAAYWQNCGVALLCQKVYSGPAGTPTAIASDPLAGTTDTNPINSAGVVGGTGATAISQYGAFFDEVSTAAIANPGPASNFVGSWVYEVQYDEPLSLEILTCDGRQRNNYYKTGDSYVYRTRNRDMDVPFVFLSTLKIYEMANNLVDVPCFPVFNDGVNTSGALVASPGPVVVPTGPAGIALQRLFIATRGGEFKKYEPEFTCGGPTTHGVCRWLNEPVPRPVDPMGQPLVEYHPTHIAQNEYYETPEEQKQNCSAGRNVRTCTKDGPCKSCPAPVYSFIQEPLEEIPQLPRTSPPGLPYSTPHQPKLTQELEDTHLCPPGQEKETVTDNSGKKSTKCVLDLGSFANPKK